MGHAGTAAASWRRSRRGLARRSTTVTRAGLTAPLPPRGNPAPRRVPFRNVASFARWWDGTTINGSGCGISRLYPVARFDKKRSADTAAAALQERVAEVRCVAAAKEHWEGDDWLYATTSPRFVVVAGSKLSDAESVTVDVQLQRFGEPPTKMRSAEESMLRSYWPHLLPILEQVEPRPSPAPTLDATNLAVLRFLGETAPRLVLNAAIEAGAQRGKQAVIAAVNRLIDQKLAARPNGPRKGTTITDEGKRLLARIR